MSFDAATAPARQFRRHAARFEARVTPHPDHAGQFRLTLPEAQCGMAVTDVSAGGLGLRCGIFLPKNLRVSLQVKALDGGSAAAALELTVRAVVRSCTMVDHRPTYQIGLQYLDPAGRDERLLVQQGAAPVKETTRIVSSGGAGVA